MTSFFSLSQGLSQSQGASQSQGLSGLLSPESQRSHKPAAKPKQARAPSASQHATSAAAPEPYNYYGDDAPSDMDEGLAGGMTVSDEEEVMLETIHSLPTISTERKETHARPPEEGRQQPPAAKDVDLLAYVTSAMEHLQLKVSQIKKSIDDESGEDHKHVDEPEEETFQNDAKWCGWGQHAPIEAKIDFVQRQTEFGTTVNPIIVGKYLITLEQICASPNVAHAIELLFGPLLTHNPHVDKNFNVATTIEINLNFCYMLEFQAFLRETPFGGLSQQQYDQRIFRLQRACSELVRWHKHMRLARDQIATGQRIHPLYEPPALEDENAQDDDRDNIKECPEQKLLEYMFQRAGADGLRRTETGVFKAIITPDGHNTRCFEHLADMVPWMRDQVRPKSAHQKEFNWLTKKGDVERYLKSHLGKQSDARFPWLKRCRTLFSFMNGIYDANLNEFYVYVTTESQLGTHVKTVFDLPHDVATARYFAEVVDLDWFKPECKGNYTWDEAKKGWRTKTPGKLTEEEKGKWRDRIHVPEHEHIFKCQDYSFENGMLDWAEAMFGRLCHEVNKLEEWQTALHLEGPAKTGKSLLLKLLMLWYYATDIGLIGDSVENKFPDQHLIGKFIVMCMDVSREFGLSPTRFLLWCAGDWLEVHRKGLEAICMQWTAPSVWASNNKPPIAASGGSAKRRYVILQFLKTIARADAKLFSRATKEVGRYLIKCNMAYHEKVATYGDWNLQDDETILPEGIRKAMREYAADSSWADAFLDMSKRFRFWKDESKKMDETQKAEQRPLFRVSRQEFETAFNYFKGSYKLPGVNTSNKNREAPVTQCTAAEFSNALHERGCKWSEDQHGFIEGLQLVPVENQAGAPANQHEQKEFAAKPPAAARKRNQPLVLPPDPGMPQPVSYASQHDPVPGASMPSLFQGLSIATAG